MAPTTRPRVVPYCSRWETLAVVPGMLVYGLVCIPFETAQVAGVGVWEYRVLDRMAELLTTADGRTGVRPVSNTSLGTGLRLFHRADAARVELASS